MTQLLFQQIYVFLKKENPSEDEIIAGATLMLKVSPGHYRALYNSAVRRPQAFLPWIRSELQKHYEIHNRGLKREDVEQYNKETVETISQTLSLSPEGIDPEDEDAAIPVTGVRGKREDHDSLPEEIKNLWDKNAERWKKMRSLHIQLTNMISKSDYEPCDGNELCFMLRQTDTDIRNDYAIYDSYELEPDTAADDHAEKDDNVVTDNVKVIQKCRAAITRNLNNTNPSEEQLAKVQEAVNTLVALKQTFKPGTLERLKAAGISIPSI